MTPQRAGLKGRNMTAQGNALGLPPPLPSSAESAQPFFCWHDGIPTS